MIAKIVADAQAAGASATDVDPAIASMWFYGAIEQLLSGWVFELIPGTDEDFERARSDGRRDDLRRARGAPVVTAGAR